EIFLRVAEIRARPLQELFRFPARRKPKQSLHFVCRQDPFAVGVDGERFESASGKIGPLLRELLGNIVGNLKLNDHPGTSWPENTMRASRSGSSTVRCADG